METTKKVGLIAATTIAAAGAAMAVGGMQVNAEELDVNETNDIQIQQEAGQSAVSLEDAQTQLKQKEADLKNAEQNIMEAEEAYSSATQAQEQAEADFDAAYEQTEDAFAETVNGANEKLEEAEQKLEKAEHSVEATQAGVDHFQNDVDELEANLAEKEKQLDNVKAEYGVSENDIEEKEAEIHHAQEELTKKEEEKAAAEENKKSAEDTVLEREQNVSEKETAVANAEAADAVADDAVEAAREKVNTVAEQLQSAEDLISGSIDITETEQYKNAIEAEDNLNTKEGEYQEAADDVKNAEKAQLDAEASQSAAEQAFKEKGAELLDQEIIVNQKNKELEQAESAQVGAQADLEQAEATAAQKTTEREQAETAENAINSEVKALEEAKKKADMEAEDAANQLNNAWENAENTVNDQISQAEQAVADQQAEFDKAKEALESAEAIYNQGSLGFIDWMLAKEGLTEDQIYDLTKAREKILSAVEEDFSRFGKTSTYLPDSRNNKVIVIGDEYDATNLANVYKSIVIMKNINELRLSDDNYVGDMQRNEAKTNFYFMALGQIATMRGAALRNHSTLMASCENLAFGYSNPNSGWYTKEKAVFDQIKSDLGITEINSSTLSQIKQEASRRNVVIGHYTNLMYAADQVMGVGFTDYGRTSGYNASAESSYVRAGYHTYTIEEFEALFMEYYNSIDPETLQENYDTANENLNAAKNAAETLKSQKDQVISSMVEALQQQLSDKQAAAIQSGEALSAAYVRAEEAKQLTIDKKQEEADANSAVLVKKAAFENTKETANRAKEESLNAIAERDRLQEAVDAARTEVNLCIEKKAEADANVLEKQAALQTAEAEVEKARTAYQEAKAKLDVLTSDQTIEELMAQKDQADAQLMEALKEKRSTADRLEKAREDLANAQDELAQAKEQVKEAELWQEAAEQDAAYLRDNITSLEEQLEEMQQGLGFIREVEAERDYALMVLEHGRAYLKSATKYLDDAKAAYAEAMEEYTNAIILFKKVENLPAVSVDMDYLEDEEFSYLNTFIAEMKAAAERVAQAKDRVLEAAENLGKSQQLYDTAQVEYASAQTDYILAKAEADKADQQRKLEQLMREKAAGYNAEPEYTYNNWFVPTANSAQTGNIVAIKPETNSNHNRSVGMNNGVKDNNKPQSNSAQGGVITSSNNEKNNSNLGLILGIAGGVAAAGAAAGIGAGVYKRRKSEDE